MSELQERLSEIKRRQIEINIAKRTVKALRGLTEEQWRRVLEMVRGEMEAQP